MKLSRYLLLALTGFSSTASLAQAPNGGVGLRYVPSAFTMPRGDLQLKITSQFHTASHHPRPGVSEDAQSHAVLTSLAYGFSPHLELEATAVLYNKFPSPDGLDPNRRRALPSDLFLRAKFGSFRMPFSRAAFGFQLASRIPLTKTRNLPQQFYTTARASWGVSGLLTFAREPLYPDDTVSWYILAGYWNHMDVGVRLAPAPIDPAIASARRPTQEVLYAVGLKIPHRKADFLMELRGNHFLQRPPRAAYSREDYLYLAPGLLYRILPLVMIELGAEVKLFAGPDRTSYPAVPQRPGLADYPAWRLHAALRFSLVPLNRFKVRPRDVALAKAKAEEEQRSREQTLSQTLEGKLSQILRERAKQKAELEMVKKLLPVAGDKEGSLAESPTEEKEKIAAKRP